ncbi:hypothetical protein [Thermoanaerobacter kivui]|nr:hypothetical protein [Thermoanaerobacter kivui]
MFSLLITFSLLIAVTFSTSFAMVSNSSDSKNIQKLEPEYIADYVTVYRSDYREIPYALNVNGIRVGTLKHKVWYSWEETWEINAVTGQKIRLVSKTNPVINDAVYYIQLNLAKGAVLKEILAPDGSYYRTLTRIEYTEPNTGLSIVREEYHTTFSSSLPTY